MVRRVPVGVVGAITPWNSPSVLGMRVVAPALALGNAVVLKPDPQTPVCGGAMFAAVFKEAGLPDGLLQIVIGDAETGDALVTDPNIDMVSFTGSTEVGRIVGAKAGGLLKKVSLELGGNNPLIVLDDADLAAAASAGAYSSFQFQGQVCFATGRHIVHRDVADEYVDLLAQKARRLRTGDPYREDVELGPIVNEQQIKRVDYDRPAIRRQRRRTPRRGRHVRGPLLPTDRFGGRQIGCARVDGRDLRPSRARRDVLRATTRRSSWPTRPSTAWPRASTRDRFRAASRSPTEFARAWSTSTTSRSTTRRRSRSAAWA